MIINEWEKEKVYEEVGEEHSCVMGQRWSIAKGKEATKAKMDLNSMVATGLCSYYASTRPLLIVIINISRRSTWFLS